MGRRLWDVFPTARGLPFAEACYRVKRTGDPESLEQYFAPTGRWYLNHIYPFGTGVSVIFEDVTERKRAEQQRDEARHRLAQFAEELDRTLEAERTEIARQIHDELGQAMTAPKYDVVRAQRRLAHSARADGGPLLDQLAEMGKHIDATVDVARRLARDLRPATLTDLGLGTALRAHAASWSNRAGIPCQCDIADMTLPPELGTTLFRIAAEALTNVLRHAQAQRAWIEARIDGGCVELLIGDDGVGFDPAAALRRTSLGLIGITERAALLGGNAEIDSSPGHGTTIRVRVPIAPAPATTGARAP